MVPETVYALLMTTTNPSSSRREPNAPISTRGSHAPTISATPISLNGRDPVPGLASEKYIGLSLFIISLLINHGLNVRINHNIREHLRRSHGRPANTCRRCLLDCRTPARLSEHLRATEACVVVPDRHIDWKMTAAQQAELQSKRRMPPNTTNEDKWNLIYRILFPETSSASIPSPCKSISICLFYIYGSGPR